MDRYNLVVLHTPGRQQISDFITVRNMMLGAAPDIDMHILSEGAAMPEDLWRRLADRPTLVFAPVHVSLDSVKRGCKLVGTRLSKLKEAELLTAAGIPVPLTKAVTPGIVLDEALWGPHTVLKPNVGTFGRGIRLVRTRDVRWVDPHSWAPDDPRHGQVELAQQFVDTGPHVQNYRVMTVLGHAVYAMISTALEPLPPASAQSVADVERLVAANGMPRRIALCFDADVIALAERVHRLFETMPNLGVDIVREAGTGRLYVLEVNSAGLSWHLSSDFGLAQQRKHGLNYYAHSNALKVLAHAFTETTRRLAT